MDPITIQRSRRAAPARRIWAIDVDKGGNAIPYHLEDPFIRKEFEERMSPEGAASRMEPKLYEGPPADGVEIPSFM
jgi:hypothetical protein